MNSTDLEPADNMRRVTLNPQLTSFNPSCLGTRPHASGNPRLPLLRAVRMDAEVARHVRVERFSAALDAGNRGAAAREGRGGTSSHADTPGIAEPISPDH